MMQAAELAVLDWLQAHLRCDFLDAVMPWISRICDHGEIWILLAAVLLLLRKHRWTGMSLSFALILVISLPLGILAARYEGGVLDKILTVLNQITMSIPNFLLRFLLTCVFSLILHWFTVGSFSAAAEQGLGAYLSYLFFPALAIALPKAAMTVKMLRGSILGEMKEDYIRTAYSKGNSKSAALWRFALRNAMIPVITFLAMTIADIVAGSIVVEQVFAIPGLGRLLVASISNRDYPVVQAIVVILAFWVVLAGTVADIVNQRIDPRPRLGGAS